MKRLTTGPRGFRGIARGIREASRLIELTYGPQGGTVIVSKRGGALAVTADGASLLREITGTGAVGLGLSLGRGVSCTVEGEAGDGTSTALILAAAWLGGLLREAPDGPGTELLVQMEEAVAQARLLLEQTVQPITRETLIRTAEIAARGDFELAAAIVGAVESAGEGGTVLLSPGTGVGLEVETREGLVLADGWVNPYPEPEPERVYEGPLVATVTAPLVRAEHLQSLLEAASQWPGRGVVVFAPDLRGSAAALLHTNDRAGVIKAACVIHRGAPAELRDWLEDIAAVTGSTVVDPGAGHLLEEFEGAWLGAARRVTLTRPRVTLLGYEEEAVYERLETRQRSLEARAEATAHEFDRDRYRERAAALGGGLCVVGVGGHTQGEAQERRSRAEDTLHSVRAALAGGAVPGSGAAFAWVARRLPTTPGGRIVSRALEAPRAALARRAGVSPAVLEQDGGPDPEDPWTGWCAGRGEWVRLDAAPATVDTAAGARAALEAAWSTVRTVARVGAVITHAPKPIEATSARSATWKRPPPPR